MRGIQICSIRFNSFYGAWWPQRTEYYPGKQNILNKSLVDPNGVLVPPLHIKPGLFKNFVKGLNKYSVAFKHLLPVFPKEKAQLLVFGSGSY